MLDLLIKFYIIVTPYLIAGSIVGGALVGGISEGLKYKHVQDHTFLVQTIICSSLIGAFIVGPLSAMLLLFFPVWAPPLFVVYLYMLLK